jgi:hypothetical protein
MKVRNEELYYNDKTLFIFDREYKHHVTDYLRIQTGEAKKECRQRAKTLR